MANVTVTADRKTNQKIAGYQFVDGVATVDNTTQAGLAVLALAKRQGWAYGATAAATVTVAEGKPVALWTDAECKTYLDAYGVEYPAGANTTDLHNAVHTAYETRAQGGSAALPAAGHTQGTFPVLDAPNVRGDDEAKADLWRPPAMPLAHAGGGDAFPVITDEPETQTVVAGATATFTVGAAGTPTPTYQWQRKGTNNRYADIASATAASYTTPATTDADNGADFRVVVTNAQGSVTSSPANLNVTPAGE
jgi:hypothetical protein